MTEQTNEYKYLRNFADAVPPRGSRFLAVGRGLYAGLFVWDVGGGMFKNGEPWWVVTTDKELHGLFSRLRLSHWIPLDDASFWEEA